MALPPIPDELSSKDRTRIQPRTSGTTRNLLKHLSEARYGSRNHQADIVEAAVELAYRLHEAGIDPTAIEPIVDVLTEHGVPDGQNRAGRKSEETIDQFQSRIEDNYSLELSPEDVDLATRRALPQTYHYRRPLILAFLRSEAESPLVTRQSVIDLGVEHFVEPEICGERSIRNDFRALVKDGHLTGGWRSHLNEALDIPYHTFDAPDRYAYTTDQETLPARNLASTIAERIRRFGQPHVTPKFDLAALTYLHRETESEDVSMVWEDVITEVDWLSIGWARRSLASLDSLQREGQKWVAARRQ